MYRWTKLVPCRTSRPLFSIDVRFNHRETLRPQEGGIFYVDWGLYIERLGRQGAEGPRGENGHEEAREGQDGKFYPLIFANGR